MKEKMEKAALVTAALRTEGKTCLEEIGYILRGYEDFDKKIAALGGKIKVKSN